MRMFPNGYPNNIPSEKFPSHQNPAKKKRLSGNFEHNRFYIVAGDIGRILDYLDKFIQHKSLRKKTFVCVKLN